ncbi:hypothetical protein EG68_00619 [Paragonimus skrjabini miyazakii]|uniref:Uncharacterized protein n=1 Tax=Paragonimus skrjabini miyazakii TaxID=59628 RepID=A0A8S9ZBZ3_9TREM|nr:hypothetical protein EG68_00619 [Paragonimus skrjabini miyazakii]
MNSVISSYLRGAPSPLSVSEAVKNLIRILENSHTGRLSPSLLEAFLLGDCSILQFMANNVNCDSQGVIMLLNRFRERGFLSSGSLSLEQLHKSLSLVFTGMKTHMTSDFWKPTVDFLTSSDILLEIIKSENLLNNICNPLLSLYALNGKMGEVIHSHAQQLYCKLLNASVSQFTEEPSIKILRSAVLLLNFGFVLVKLAPGELTFLLDKVMNALHVITSGSPERKQQLDRLRNGNGRLNLMDVVKFSPTKLLSLFASLLPRVPCQILSIMKSLIVLLPELTMEEQTFQLILKILMEGIRLPVSVDVVSGCDDDEKENVQNMQPAIFALRMLVKLVDMWHCFEVPSERRASMMYQLFDLLRVFPCSLEHAEVRLLAWWHFICRLPRELLNDGFRRFVSPFLANLIGRYLSISAPMGDPQLHRYKLSEGNAYGGNRKALELTQHVFACFFQSPTMELKRLDYVPTLQLDKSVLSHNSYQLLVALVHWLRLICGHSACLTVRADYTTLATDCLPTMDVDRIWIECVRCVLGASCAAPPSVDEEQTICNLRSPSVGNKTIQSASGMILQHVSSCTCHLVTPSSFAGRGASEKSSDLPVASPNPSQCLTILEALMELTLTHPVPHEDKMEILFDLLIKSAELGCSWMRRDQKLSALSNDSWPNILDRWANFTILLMNSNSLLNVKPQPTKHLRVGESFLHLIHQFLSALLPDCIHLASSHSFTEYSSQDSSLSVFLGQTPVILYCSQVLRVWTEVADRLTHFIVSEQCICEGDSVVAPDLTTVEAAILAPFWLAGPTPPSSDGCLGSNKASVDSYLSNKDEVALAKRMASLFTAFHQEACLLTTVASNAWIDELGLKLVTLISAIISEPSQCLNFNLLGRLLRCFAQNAERVHESVNSKASLNPFAWRPTQDRPFGQLTGLLLSLKLCLLHSPWFNPPSQSPSPSEHVSSASYGRYAELQSRVITSPPAISAIHIQRTAEDESSSSASQLTLAERLAATSYKISCGLIDAIEAVGILIQNHVRTPELLQVLVETLNPALSRLATCCARAEIAVQAAGTELDEPLLITQRRQQAKAALEDLFINIWRALGCCPVVLDEAGLSSSSTAVRSLSINSSVASGYKAFPLAPHQCMALLHSALTLSKPTTQLPVQHTRPFILWLIGFWNGLVDTYLVEKSSRSRGWEAVQKSLVEHEDTVRTLVRSVPTEASCTPGTPRTARKTRGKATLQPLDDEECDTSNKRSPGEKISLKQQPASGETSARGRPKRTRLSLKSPLAGQQTTPVKRSLPPVQLDNLTRSAPSNLGASRRGRGRRSMLTAHSPLNSASGILAAHLGIQPGVNVIECLRDRWSPVSGSPGPMPGRPLIKRRLFMGQLDESGDADKSCKPVLRIGHPATARKRTMSDSDPTSVGPRLKLEEDDSVLRAPLPIDFEESAQFAFIPPVPDNPRKRRRNLTAHQKEHFREQKEDYLPITYTELDLSQQSSGCDSQSQSQHRLSGPSWDQFRSCVPHESTSDSAVDVDVSSDVHITNSEAVTEIIRPIQSDVVDLSVLSQKTAQPVVEASGLLPTDASDMQKPEVLISPVQVDINQTCEKSQPWVPDTSVQLDLVASDKQHTLGTTSNSETKESTDHELPILESDSTLNPRESPRLARIENTSTSPTIAHLLKSACPTTPPSLTVPMPAPVNRCSPLIRSASSRAQRMLVLGLQKAAEQNARHKRSEPLSEPTTPEGKNSPTAISPSVGQSLITDSPSGIMRNFSSRKKVQRVSFAERPVVYTFGFSESPPFVSDLPTPLKSDESVQLVLSTPDSTLVTQTSDSVSTDLKAVNANSDEVAVDTQESPASSSIVVSYCPPVDLDDSHSSRPPGTHSPPHEWESPLLPTVSHDSSDPIAFTHRNRKSTSPQRRLIVPKTVVTSPSTVLTSLVKPVLNVTSMVRLPERRRLFVSKSTEENDAIEVVSETEPDEIGIDSTRSATVIVLDSEPVEITDTQPSQDNTSPDPTFKVSDPPSTEDDSECMLIESSQGTQETSELKPANLSSEVRLESSQLDDAPVFALHRSAPLSASDRPLFIPRLSDSEELVTQVSATEEDETQRDSSSDSCTPERSANDVESFIRCSLSQIASRLSSLSPTRHQSVLMEVLSTFKPIMH